MSSYRWIGPNGEETEFQGEEQVLAALYSGRIDDQDLIRMPNSGSWVKAHEVKAQIVGSMRGIAPQAAPVAAPPSAPEAAPAASPSEGWARAAGAEPWSAQVSSESTMAAVAPARALPRGTTPWWGAQYDEPQDAPRPDEWVETTAPWRRYWARSIDLLISAFVAFIVGALLFPAVLDGPQADTTISILAVILVFPLLDALFLSQWNTSPGKWMLSLRTVPASGGITFGRAYSRAWSMLARGTWFWFPLLCMIPLVDSCIKASSGEKLPWEKNYETRTIARGLGWPFAVLIVGAGLFFFFYRLGIEA